MGLEPTSISLPHPGPYSTKLSLHSSAGGVLLDLTYISQDRAIPPQAGRIRLATYDAQAGGRVMYTTRAQRPFYFQRRGSGLAPLRLLLEAGPDDLKESA